MTRPWTPDAADPALAALAATEHLLVALDFDGTASPLVDDPMSARALPEVRAEVERLAALPATTVAYVSGRSLHHLREIAEHDDDSPIVLSGSHGAEYWFPEELSRSLSEERSDETKRSEIASEREEISAAAETILEQHPGARFEPKSLGFGIHTRGADPEVERAVFSAVDAFMAERAPSWRRRQGHNILEFSSSSTGKDTAIKNLRERFAASAILFAGDDVTDEDAMRVLTSTDVGVRVGPGETAATLRITDPTELAPLLSQLADLRTR